MTIAFPGGTVTGVGGAYLASGETANKAVLEDDQSILDDKKQNVGTVPLDSVIVDQHIPLMKIDVEGCVNLLLCTTPTYSHLVPGLRLLCYRALLAC
jgi:hypothetical protein